LKRLNVVEGDIQLPWFLSSRNAITMHCQYKNHKIREKYSILNIQYSILTQVFFTESVKPLLLHSITFRVNLCLEKMVVLQVDREQMIFQ